jgi:hypothetical protein
MTLFSSARRASRLPLAVLVRLVAPLAAALALAAGGGCAGCSSKDAPAGSGAASLGVTCASSTNAADAASIRSALAGSAAGACVVVPAGSFAGPFTVPAGVALVAQTGARVTVTGGTAQEPAITLGEGAKLALVDVVDPAGVGVAVRAASALLASVTVKGAKNAAVAVLCHEGPNQGCAAGTITMSDVMLSTSTLGLWVSGAHVAWNGGSSASNAGTGLASAAGVIAQDGAKLELENVTVEKNEGVGVLVDGATSTASIKTSIVNENGERGIWAQRVSGTLDAPAVRIENTVVTKNKIVGVGAVESHGIIIVSGRIADTVAAPVVTNLESTESVGDGFGVFSSGDFKVEGTSLETNARAAGVIDSSDRGIIIVSGVVGTSGSGLKVVVQNTKGADVQVAATDQSMPPKALGVSAPKLSLPSVL